MIAFFVYNLNKYSGAAQQALLLARFLDLPIVFFNHESGGFSKKVYNEKILIVNLPSRRFFSLFVIVWYVARLNVKIIHLHGFFRHGLLLGGLLRKPVILKTTLMDSDDLLTIQARTKNKIWFKILVSCITLNVCLTQQLKAANGLVLDKIKIRIIPNAVEVQEKTPNKADNAFCFMGLICERKGAYESIEYYLRFYSRLANSLMYVIGPLEGLHESDAAYIKKCFDLVESYRASDKVIFTGNLDKLDAIDVMKKCKALIFFSQKEGMPNVVLEAMANNCAPVTTGINGVMNEILDEHTISMVTARDFLDKVEVSQIDKVVRSKTLVHQAQEKFSLKVVVSAYLDIYKSFPN